VAPRINIPCSLPLYHEATSPCNIEAVDEAPLQHLLYNTIPEYSYPSMAFIRVLDQLPAGRMTLSLIRRSPHAVGFPYKSNELVTAFNQLEQRQKQVHSIWSFYPSLPIHSHV